MNNSLENILFIDIETVPLYEYEDEIPENLKELYVPKKTKKEKKAELNCDSTTEEQENFGGSGFSATFGKVVCVSLGRYDGGINDEHFKIRSLYDYDEKKILIELSDILSRSSNFKLCAHNGLNFDFPFLGRRYLINKIPLPSKLNFMGKKPWNLEHIIDTMELWKFAINSPQENISLKLLCALFDIPSPKDDIDGSQVAHVYYKEKNIERIAKYCEKDVKVTAQVLKNLWQVE